MKRLTCICLATLIVMGGMLSAAPAARGTSGRATFRVWISSRPSPCMASPALRTRFMITCCTCEGSACKGGRSSRRFKRREILREMATRSITVNVVAPGYIETDMTADFSDDMRTAVLSRIPMGRTGK